VILKYIVPVNDGQF